MASRPYIVPVGTHSARTGILIADERRAPVSPTPAIAGFAVAVACTQRDLCEQLWRAEWWLGLVVTGLGPHPANELADVLRQSGRVSDVLIAAPSGDSSGDTSPWVLDARQRRVLGLEMPALLRGEFLLLQFLGRNARKWYSSCELARLVYLRDDPVARQLVWKYWSTLKNKLGSFGVADFQGCRRRGYRSMRKVVMLESVDRELEGGH